MLLCTLDDKLWPEEAPGKRCDQSEMVTDIDQLGCQAECESRSSCVGIERSVVEPRVCYVCDSDNLLPSANGFGFYRRPSN